MTAESPSPASPLLSEAVKGGESLGLLVNSDFFSTGRLSLARSQSGSLLQK